MIELEYQGPPHQPKEKAAVGLSKLSKKVEAMLRQTCEGSVETLKRGDTFRLDNRSRMLRVRTGQIWLSWDGEDYVLDAGEDMLFPTGTADAVLSVTEGDEAMFELLCIPRAEASR
jgi:hypothetical protein